VLFLTDAKAKDLFRSFDTELEQYEQKKTMW